jgi:hypothetical protein
VKCFDLFDWFSKLIYLGHREVNPLATATAARYTAVVVFPTPPLRFVITTFIETSQSARFLTTRSDDGRLGSGSEGDRSALQRV